MLGFSAFAETPLASAATSLAALGYLATTTAQVAAGTVLYDAQAGPVLPATTASFIANAFGDVDAKATTQLVNAIATFDLNDLLYDADANITTGAATASFVADSFADVDAQATTNLASVFATNAVDIDFDAKANITTSSTESSFAINSVTNIAKANIVPPAATSLGTANNFQDVDAKALINIVSVGFSTYINDLEDVEGEGGASPAGVISTFSQGVFDFVAEASIVSPSAVGTFTANSFADVDAQASITTSGSSITVSANNFDAVDAQASTVLGSTNAYLTIYITDFADEDAQATVLMPPAVSTTNVNLDQATGVRFDFESLADSYERSRTVYLVSYGDNRTVSIIPENYTVYIDRELRDYTVYITRQG